MCINESLLPSRHRHSGFDRRDSDQRHRGRGPLGLLSPEHDGRALAHRTSAQEAQDQDDVLEEQRRRGAGGHGRIPGSRGGRRRRRRSRGNVQLRLRRDLAAAETHARARRYSSMRITHGKRWVDRIFFLYLLIFYRFVGLDFLYFLNVRWSFVLSSPVSVCSFPRLVLAVGWCTLLVIFIKISPDH